VADLTTRVARVSWFVIVIVAPETATPPGSRTVPVILPGEGWASVGVAERMVSAAETTRIAARDWSM
jgi:hypothetical protein